LGYYILSSEAVDAVDLPEMPKLISKKAPQIQAIWSGITGRLAVDKSQQGQGLESHYLWMPSIDA
jgi:hypothetical protein